LDEITYSQYPCRHIYNCVKRIQKINPGTSVVFRFLRDFPCLPPRVRFPPVEKQWCIPAIKWDASSCATATCCCHYPFSSASTFKAKALLVPKLRAFSTSALAGGGWVASTLRPLSFLDRRLNWPQSQSGHANEESFWPFSNLTCPQVTEDGTIIWYEE
jgi:hypothetical protein